MLSLMTMFVKVYEINTMNYYRANLREIDTAINLDGLTYSVIGVLPARFDFPRGSFDLWIPWQLTGEAWTGVSDDGPMPELRNRRFTRGYLLRGVRAVAGGGRRGRPGEGTPRRLGSGGGGRVGVL